MNIAPATRIDKFLWAVRLYKTRTQASEACSKGHIKMNGMPVKPSHLIKTNDEFQVRREQIFYTFLAKAIIENRVGAKLVENYLIDNTPQEEKEKLELAKISSALKRERGTGRPTKKERRDIDKLFG